MAPSTSWQCSVVILTVSSTVSEIKRFFQTRNDVMLIYPTGGAVCSSYYRVLKGRRWLPINVTFSCFTYFQPFQSYLIFSFWLWFPYWRRKCGGTETPKTDNFEKHLLRGHFLASDHIFWAIVLRAACDFKWLEFVSVVWCITSMKSFSVWFLQFESKLCANACRCM